MWVRWSPVFGCGVVLNVTLVDPPTDRRTAPAPEAGMSAQVRAKDWSRTPLGPMDRWPQSLRTVVGTCLAAPTPMVLWWGPDLTLIYNDAYAPILGRKHPDALGRSGRD